MISIANPGENGGGNNALTASETKGDVRPVVVGNGETEMLRCRHQFTINASHWADGMARNVSIHLMIDMCAIAYGKN